MRVRRSCNGLWPSIMIAFDSQPHVARAVRIQTAFARDVNPRTDFIPRLYAAVGAVYFNSDVVGVGNDVNQHNGRLELDVAHRVAGVGSLEIEIHHIGKSTALWCELKVG